MDWNRLMLLVTQALVVLVLAGLIAAGHNSVLTDALLAICGSITGIGAYQVVKRK